MNATSFLKSHKTLLKEQGRLRVARQLHAILNDWYKKGELNKLRVLDYGCSAGIVTNYIAGYFKTVVGIDVDEIAIKEAVSKYKRKNLSFLVNTGIKIPFRDKSFDLVICNQVYSYLDNPKLMIEEIHRVLKSGGICLFTGDNLLRPIEPLYNLPFIRLLPESFTILLLKSLGHKNIYTGNYLSFWGLKKLCSKFNITDYTIKVIKNPGEFEYKKLERYSAFLRVFPDFIFKVAEPFFPSFVFILKKE